MHQFTIGASGREPKELCKSNLDASEGTFLYAENKHLGFALVHVVPEAMTYQIKGIRNFNPGPDAAFDKKIYDLFRVTIDNEVSKFE